MEVYGFSDGDVKHIIDSIKLKGELTVQCCERDEGEDSSGDSRYPPATLVHHGSSIAAVKATLEHNQTVSLDAIKNAALRVGKLTEMQNMIVVEIRAACFDPTLNSAKRCQIMHTVIANTLKARGDELLLCMADSPETDNQAIWTKATQNSAGCVEGLVEKVVNKVGQITMANYEVKFFREEHAMALVNYNETINKLMPAVKGDARTEIHPYYPEQTPDTKMVDLYNEKVEKANKNNNKIIIIHLAGEVKKLTGHGLARSKIIIKIIMTHSSPHWASQGPKVETH